MYGLGHDEKQAYIDDTYWIDRMCIRVIPSSKADWADAAPVIEYHIRSTVAQAYPVSKNEMRMPCG